MSTRLYIEDDGDEVVTFRINDHEIGTASHEDYGWGGMEKVISTVEALCDAFGIPVTNTQDIV